MSNRILTIIDGMVEGLKRNPSFTGDSPAKGAGYTVRGRFKATPHHSNVLAKPEPRQTPPIIEGSGPAFLDLTDTE